MYLRIYNAAAIPIVIIIIRNALLLLSSFRKAMSNASYGGAMKQCFFGRHEFLTIDSLAPRHSLINFVCFLIYDLNLVTVGCGVPGWIEIHFFFRLHGSDDELYYVGWNVSKQEIYLEECMINKIYRKDQFTKAEIPDCSQSWCIFAKELQ